MTDHAAATRLPPGQENEDRDPPRLRSPPLGVACGEPARGRDDRAGPRVSAGAELVRLASTWSARRSCTGARRTSGRDSRAGKHRTRAGTGHSARSEAARRPSGSCRDDGKLAQDLGVEHRVLKAGVHRLRVSDCNPGPSIFSASSLAKIVTARSSRPRLSRRPAQPPERDGIRLPSTVFVTARCFLPT